MAVSVKPSPNIPSDCEREESGEEEEEELFPFINRPSRGPTLLNNVCKGLSGLEDWVVDDGNEDWLSKSPTPKDSFDCEREESGEEEEEELFPFINRPSRGPTLLKMFVRA